MDSQRGRRFRKRSRTQRGIIGALVAMIWLAIPLAVQAHPLGNFTVNRYSRLDLGLDGETAQIALTYVIDMAEIPTHQARTAMDANNDGTISAAEETAYATAQLAQLQDHLYLTVDGARLPWAVQDWQLTFPEGQAGLPTLRLQVHFNSALPAQDSPRRAEFRDENYAGRLGWQEVIVRPASGIALLASTVPTDDVSQELHRYPDDLLQSPLAVNAARFQFAPAAAVDATSAPVIVNDTQTARAALLPSLKTAFTTGNNRKDPFADLVTTPLSGPMALVLALLAAFGWGAAHALSPGHGKTIVGAYLVGSRGTVRHAVFLGITTTITHTAGVFALGLVTLLAAQFILPETLFPWLSLLSGLLVVIIGLSMARRWIGNPWRRELHEHSHAHDHTHHQHAHVAPEPIAHAHAHPHHHDYPHTHTHEHEHDHAHDHSHTEGTYYHRDSLGRWHSHALPNIEREAVTWRSLLALGISGGLLPCPSALVVMLGAIALQRVGFGLLLIVAFSLGLSGVLTAIGIALVSTGKLIERLPANGRLLRVMPVASALFITLLGAGITVQAWLQIWPT